MAALKGGKVDPKLPRKTDSQISGSFIAILRSYAFLFYAVQ